MSWNVDYARAYIAWFTHAAPDDATMTAVTLWVELAIANGPPDDAALVYGDLYTAIVPDVGVRVNFLAIMQDRSMIVKEFR